MEIKKKNNLQSPVFGYKNKLIRVLWGIIYYCAFRFSPVPFFGYRRLILRCFGAKVGKKVNVYPSAKIWLPSNLIIDDFSTLGPNVNIYNQATITLGKHIIVSQGAYLCASSHDYNDILHSLLLCPIKIKDNVWLCTESFVGPNVTVKQGAVLGAKAVLMKDSSPWCVYAGNPAKLIKKRVEF
jgi:putative colanic acid biosynthesis acetyltransferase WcaF